MVVRKSENKNSIVTGSRILTVSAGWVSRVFYFYSETREMCIRTAADAYSCSLFVAEQESFREIYVPSRRRRRCRLFRTFSRAAEKRLVQRVVDVCHRNQTFGKRARVQIIVHVTTRRHRAASLSPSPGSHPRSRLHTVSFL